MYFRNYLGYSKKGQGFIYKKVYTVEGSFANIMKVGDLFAKDHKVEVFLIKLNKEEGVLGKMPPLLPPPSWSEQRKGIGGVGGANPGGQGLGGGFGVREKGERGPRGRFPAAAQAEAARVGLAATGCGSGRWRLWAGDSESRRRAREGGKGRESIGGTDAHLGLGCGATGRGAPRWPVLGAAAMVGGGAGRSGRQSWCGGVALRGLV